MRRESKKQTKKRDFISQQKVGFFIWVFEYTLVSVGKGVPALFFFLNSGLFFRFFICFFFEKNGAP
jgi:hypothetical protein